MFCLKSSESANLFETRMHSSRMRTGRSLTVCRSLLPGGAGPGGVWSGGVSAPRGGLLPEGGLVCSLGGVYSRGVCSGGVVVSQHALRQNPPWTESQTPVKTLPWPNFVAAGNKCTNPSFSLSQHSSVSRASAWSHTVSSGMIGPGFEPPPMPNCS